MSSPGEKIMKLDMASLRSAIDFWEFSHVDLEHVLETYKDIAEYPEHFRSMFRLFSFPREGFETDYIKYKNERDGKTSAWEFVTDFLNGGHQHHKIPMFYERQGFTITLEAFDLLSKFNFVEIPDYSNTARIMRPFEGWSLCVREEFASGSAISRAIEGVWTETTAASTPTGGRPSVLRDEMAAAYKRVFPEGHSPNSWYYALRKVSEITGRTASVDTLKRAVSRIA